jgi:hypothetical protein
VVSLIFFITEIPDLK